jgi:hypothetical protein
MPALQTLPFSATAPAEADPTPLVWCAEWEVRWTAELTAQLDSRPAPELGNPAAPVVMALWAAGLAACLSVGLSAGLMVF